LNMSMSSGYVSAIDGEKDRRVEFQIFL
jgi:hypothetical protein